MFSRSSSSKLASYLLLAAIPAAVSATDILETHGFSTCIDDASIEITNLDIKYDRANQQVTFNVAGTSTKEQNVTASLQVYAYGKSVYQKDFNPCDASAYVANLCPVKEGSFAAVGEQDIPSSYADMIPSIAFTVPDLDGTAKLELKSLDTGEGLACITSTVSNGKSMSVPAVSYVAAGIAAAALLLSGLSALGAGGHAGSATPSPTFGEVIGWFQGMAMNGMLSVQYPAVYRSFASNFAFSTGLVPWGDMQTAIDNFRNMTGGNLTHASYEYLRNATLVYDDSSNSSSLTKRAFTESFFWVRDELSTTVNGTTTGNATSNSTSGGIANQEFVKNLQAYVEELTIPKTNTFMTVLLVFAIIIAAITVGILLFKVILETWALFGTFPKSLTSFRKRYWWLLAKTITNLILLLYGVWTLYCVYQFTNGDSWAAKTLAGVTLGIFTAILMFFTFRIWQLANKFKKLEGDASALYEDKETWRKYSLFYENFKKGYWWMFVPAIVYMFAKGCIIAGGDGHGLAQTAGQLIVESLMLILFLWSRPYTMGSGNWINIIIQIVRVLSVVCILVFVEELGIDQTTQTITGVVLIVVQSVLTGVLAILIAVNSIIICCRENPHRKKRKEAEKLNRDLDDLTPLDARNSLLMDPSEYKRSSAAYKAPLVSAQPLGPRGYDPVPPVDTAYYGGHNRMPSREQQPLIHDAASMGGHDDHRGPSPTPDSRAPQLPAIEPHYRGMAY